MKTDKKTLELWDKVQEKKKEIAKAEKPVWKTNCSFSFGLFNDKDRVNLQTISDLNILTMILAFLIQMEEAWTKASNALGITSKFNWMSFSREDWEADIKTRVTKIQITTKKKEFESLEARLNSILSPEMKAELELAEIEKALK